MLLFLRSVFFLTAFLLTISYALRRGGGPERAVAGMMAAGLIASLIDLSFVAGRFHAPAYGVALTDFVMLIGFTWLALTADRFWTLWLAAVQAMPVLSHLAMILKPVPLPEYYKNTVQLWSYPLVALLAVGTLRYQLRRGTATRFECWLGRVGAWFAKLVTRDRTARHGAAG
jgi:hypothetical protein